MRRNWSGDSRRCQMQAGAAGWNALTPTRCLVSVGSHLSAATPSALGSTRSTLEPAAETDLGDQAVDVLRGDAVGDDRAGVVGLQVEMDAVFAAGPDKVFHEIHAAAGPHPGIVGIRVLRLDDDVVAQKNVTVERQVAEGGEPRGRIDQLIPDDERHRVRLSSSNTTANFGTTSNLVCVKRQTVTGGCPNLGIL